MLRPCVFSLTSASTAAGLTPLAAATRFSWMDAFCGEI